MTGSNTELTFLLLLETTYMHIKDIYQGLQVSRRIFYGCMVSVFVKLRKHRYQGWSKRVLLRKPLVPFNAFQTNGCLFSLMATQEILCCLLELLLELGSYQKQPESWVFLQELRCQPHSSTPMQED